MRHGGIADGGVKLAFYDSCQRRFIVLIFAIGDVLRIKIARHGAIFSDPDLFAQQIIDRINIARELVDGQRSGDFGDQDRDKNQTG